MTHAHIVEGLIYNGSGRHCQHAAEEELIHVAPTEKTAHGTAYTHHATHHQKSTDNRPHTHLHYLLERELKAQGKHEEDDADLAPVLHILHIGDGRHVDHVGTREESGHNIAQYQRLLEALEDDGRDTGYNKDVGQVGDDNRQITHFFFNALYYPITSTGPAFRLSPTSS